MATYSFERWLAWKRDSMPRKDFEAWRSSREGLEAICRGFGYGEKCADEWKALQKHIDADRRDAWAWALEVAQGDRLKAEELTLEQGIFPAPWGWEQVMNYTEWAFQEAA